MNLFEFADTALPTPLPLAACCSGAVIDPSGVYRYSLWREWDTSRPRLCWVMLNPSTADASQDDPTIRRCIGFAKAWDYGSIEVVNLFAFRATSPDDMRTAHDPVGPENDTHIFRAAVRSSRIIAAWGVHGAHRSRDREVSVLLERWRVHHLGLTKDGRPRHPLYVARNTEPESWPKMAAARPEREP